MMSSFRSFFFDIELTYELAHNRLTMNSYVSRTKYQQLSLQSCSCFVLTLSLIVEPVHFLSHHRPLLFVAGLDGPPAPSSASPPSDSQGPTAPSPSASSASSLPSTPPTKRRTSSVSDDPFVVLAHRLRSTLTHRGQASVWEPQTKEKNKDFHVILVDKVRLQHHDWLLYKRTDSPCWLVCLGRPPTSGQGDRRAAIVRIDLQPDTEITALPVHTWLTPLPRRTHRTHMGPQTHVSLGLLHGDYVPLTIASPPDRDLLPAVFVLFMRLSESEDTETNKVKDDELVKELIGRKKALADRAIKLTVVLIASRELLGQ